MSNIIDERVNNSISNQEHSENEYYRSPLQTSSRGESYHHHEGSMQQFNTNADQYQDRNHFLWNLRNRDRDRDLSSGSVINTELSHQYMVSRSERLQSVSDRVDYHNDNRNRNGNCRNGNYRNGNQHNPSVKRTSQISVVSSPSQMSTWHNNIRLVQSGENVNGNYNYRFGHH